MTGMRAFDRPARALAVAVALALGCATSNARIYRPDGPPLSAEIDGSDASVLVLRVPRANKWEEEPRRVALGQYQVSSIDHPGNVLAMIGLGAAGVGTAETAWLIWTLRQPGRMDNGFSGIVGAITIGTIVAGLSMFAFNGLVWGRSKAHARAFEQARPPESLIPPPAGGDSETVPPPQPPPGTDDESPGEAARKGLHR
jgi:hypothetical protein